MITMTKHFFVNEKDLNKIWFKLYEETYLDAQQTDINFGQETQVMDQGSKWSCSEIPPDGIY